MLVADCRMRYIQRDRVHDVGAATRHRAVPHVLRYLAVHRARCAELRSHDRCRLQCCGKNHFFNK